MPGFIGPMELIVFGVVALLIFGPKKLPEMGRSLGKGLREFKESVSQGDEAKHPEVVAGLQAMHATETPEDHFSTIATSAPAPAATTEPTTPVAR
ncbi:MAG: preprotein translocase subunit TatA [Thermoleophilia bacterium]|nr:preprotein translocase subunit TatA [Thermoleophilia bacterium]